MAFPYVGKMSKPLLRNEAFAEERADGVWDAESTLSCHLLHPSAEPPEAQQTGTGVYDVLTFSFQTRGH